MNHGYLEFFSSSYFIGKSYGTFIIQIFGLWSFIKHSVAVWYLFFCLTFTQTGLGHKLIACGLPPGHGPTQGSTSCPHRSHFTDIQPQDKRRNALKINILLKNLSLNFFLNCLVNPSGKFFTIFSISFTNVILSPPYSNNMKVLKQKKSCP